MRVCGLEGDAINVWRSPTYGDCRWQGHLMVEKPKVKGKYPSCYTLKMYQGFTSPVQVQQWPDGWRLYVLGELLGTYKYKTDAQIEAEELLGVR